MPMPSPLAVCHQSSRRVFSSRNLSNHPSLSARAAVLQ